MPFAEPSSHNATQLHAPLEPYASLQLEVGDGHRLYVEQCGNPLGLPAVYLHGGPGSGCSPRHRQFFDPALYRTVLFDQRACGRSSPPGELAHNDTDALVQDMETLRHHLGISRWLVVGGSWGGGLAIAYAARHAEACLGLILRGTFLARSGDIAWFFGEAAARLPQAWEALMAQTGSPAAADVLPRLHAALHGADAAAALAHALAWEAWEQSLSQHAAVAARTLLTRDPQAEQLINKYRIQSHYLTHQCFRHGAGLLPLGCELPGLPIAILHGLQDWICRPEAAWHLYQQLPGSRLQWVEGGGHSPFEPGNAAALVATIGHFAIHHNFTHWGTASPHAPSP